jgi:phage-related protein
LAAIVKGVIDLVNGWPEIKERLSNIWGAITSWFKKAIDWIKEPPGKVWGFLKELPGLIWEHMKSLGSIIWEHTKIGFETVSNWLSEVWQSIKDFWNDLTQKVESLKEGFVAKLQEGWEFIKGLPEKIWTELQKGFRWVVSRLGSIWTTLKGLPQKIWDKMKSLGSIIASKIKGAIRDLNPFKDGEKVDDAIVTSSGRVLKTSPQDTIIATKNPGGFGGPGNVNITFNGVTPQDMIEIIKRELGVDLRRASRF